MIVANDATPGLAALYVALMTIGLAGSAFFSGLETAIYSMSRLRLIVRLSRGDAAANLLREEVDQPQRIISTILISNNALNFLVSFAITALLQVTLGLGDWSIIGVQAVLLTPLLFIFAETLPKDLARAHADAVVYRTAPLLRGIRLALTWTGVLWFFRMIGEALARRLGGGLDSRTISARARMAAMIEEGVGHGAISPLQTDIVDRALTMRHITVRQEMVPWPRIHTLRHDDTLDTVRRRPRLHEHARCPVVDDRRQVIGIVEIVDLLIAPEGTQAGALARPVSILDPTLDTRSAIATLRRTGATLALVGTPDRPLGLIALTDLVEPLVGEMPAP